MMRIHSLTVLAALTTAALPATVALADAKEDAIDARRGYYQVVKHNAAMLGGMAKGSVEYDAATATAHAKNLAALAKMDTGSMWPAGSDNSAMPGKTRALPVAWSTFPAITEKQEAFVTASETLAEEAGEGLDALRANVGPLFDSCKACHDTYRAKDF